MRRATKASQIDDMITVSYSGCVPRSPRVPPKRRAFSSTRIRQGARRNHQGRQAWGDPAGVSGDTQLDGQGTNSRDVVISTTLTAGSNPAVLSMAPRLVASLEDVEVNSNARYHHGARHCAVLADVGQDNTIRLTAWATGGSIRKGVCGRRHQTAASPLPSPAT